MFLLPEILDWLKIRVVECARHETPSLPSRKGSNVLDSSRLGRQNTGRDPLREYAFEDYNNLSPGSQRPRQFGYAEF